MAITIMKRVKFCAGHRLYQHGGKCEFFHGHNYVAEFYVTGSEVDSVGRLVDFAELKRAFKGWIDENWDHGFLLASSDENGLNAIKQVVPCKYYELPFNPTAENMARYLLEEVCPRILGQFPDHQVRASKVVIWETDDSCAEVSAPVEEESTHWQVAQVEHWQRQF